MSNFKCEFKLENRYFGLYNKLIPAGSDIIKYIEKECPLINITTVEESEKFYKNCLHNSLITTDISDCIYIINIMKNTMIMEQCYKKFLSNCNFYNVEINNSISEISQNDYEQYVRERRYLELCNKRKNIEKEDKLKYKNTNTNSVNNNGDKRNDLYINNFDNSLESNIFNDLNQTLSNPLNNKITNSSNHSISHLPTSTNDIETKKWNNNDNKSMFVGNINNKLNKNNIHSSTSKGINNNNEYIIGSAITSILFLIIICILLFIKIRNNQNQNQEQKPNQNQQKDQQKTKYQYHQYQNQNKSINDFDIIVEIVQKKKEKEMILLD
ncbi:hypothetical protein PIROE2DRAFT_11759 [Piromyces sp. E2]|nr:hypothetical protein PIROE2DRAFT_11759 [Piromyces sp. E2]|eukprot:OUM62054.1 hypothetical protein PIROE2DRAFT_11759 [Piromyces sp. E2]